MTVCRYFARGHCAKSQSCTFEHALEVKSSQPQHSSKAPQEDAKRNRNPSKSTCVFNLGGYCRNGDTCSFSHDVHPQPYEASQSATSSLSLDTLSIETGPPRTAPLIPCQYFLNGVCNKGDCCTFVHSSSAPLNDEDLAHSQPVEVSQPSGDSRSSVFCRYFLLGSCKNGQACPYFHDRDLENGEADTKLPEEESLDDFQRELYGAVVQFAAGGRVESLALPSDYSAIWLSGLPPQSSSTTIIALIKKLGYDTKPSDLRILQRTPPVGTCAYIQVKDESFAKAFCSSLSAQILAEAGCPSLEAKPTAVTVGMHSGAGRTDCKKVRCSWHKPSRIVWLNFGSGAIAERVHTMFMQGRYQILQHLVQASLPPKSNSHRNRQAYTVILNDVPAKATESDIEHAIYRPHQKPRHIEMGAPNYTTSMEKATAQVRCLLEQFGKLDFWEVNTILSPKRIKAMARFLEEKDAREAVSSLSQQILPFSPGGKLTIQIAHVAKFKVTTAIFDATEARIQEAGDSWRQQNLQFAVYPITNIRQTHRVMKVEGESATDVAKAKDCLNKILAGTVATKDNRPLWSAAFKNKIWNNQVSKSVKAFHGVTVIRNLQKSHLQLYGSPEDCRYAEEMLVELIHAEASTVHNIELDEQQFRWACSGGLRAIADELGHDSATLDIVSTPKRILITASPDRLQVALAIIRGSNKPAFNSQAAAESCCPICLGIAENPIQTSCNHLYCLDCFEGLCASAKAASTTSQGFPICCYGDDGNCNTIFSLKELQDHLSSSSFEDLLEASLSAYISLHPQLYHYCSSPDCGYFYRITPTQDTNTCPNCLRQTCTACHSCHEGTTCHEHKYLKSGGYEEFEKTKKKLGIKDCPFCKAPIEKTAGCNHINCFSCKAHICWACLETFTSGEDCYAHMRQKHGGHVDLPLDFELDWIPDWVRDWVPPIMHEWEDAW